MRILCVRARVVPNGEARDRTRSSLKSHKAKIITNYKIEKDTRIGHNCVAVLLGVCVDVCDEDAWQSCSGSASTKPSFDLHTEKMDKPAFGMQL